MALNKPKKGNPATQLNALRFHFVGTKRQNPGKGGRHRGLIYTQLTCVIWIVPALGSQYANQLGGAVGRVSRHDASQAKRSTATNRLYENACCAGQVSGVLGPYPPSPEQTKSLQR